MMGNKRSDRIEYLKHIEMKEYLVENRSTNRQVTKYNLFGITEHIGRSDNSGHYTAHTLREGSWFSFDDEFFK